VAAGCGSGNDCSDLPGDPGADLPLVDAIDAGMELPPFEPTCSNCHEINKLSEPIGDESAGRREWMTENGNGLVVVDSALPGPGVQFGHRWKNRGRHDENEPGCSMCHPVRDDGIGHEVKAYPAPATVFEPGTSCGGSCHSWLKVSVESRGFAGKDGEKPLYEGSARPAELLMEVDTAHTKLWREGARPDPSRFHISAFNAGCGGCHNIAAEPHGTITTCLGCHEFGASHADHIVLIDSNMAVVDAGAAAAGMDSCAYCHVDDEAPFERANAACYNCHLSGHQPLDINGNAHFWQ